LKKKVFNLLESMHSLDQLEKIDALTQIIAWQKLELEGKLQDEEKMSYVLSKTNDRIEGVKKAVVSIGENLPSFKGLFDFDKYFVGMEKALIQILFEITNVKENEIEALFQVIEKEVFKRLSAESSTTYEVNKLITDLLQPNTGSVYDGTAGFGGTLIEVAKQNPSIEVYGEEINDLVVRIANLHLYIKTGKIGRIKKANILVKPSYIEQNKLQQFDYVTMHAPFGLRVHSTELFDQDPYNRYVYGQVTQRNVDFAFLMHGIASLNERGKGAFLLPGGPLMRGGADETIRRNLITSDLIEAVIALPERLLLNTGIPIYIVIVNKQKDKELKEKVFFINASKEFEQERRNNHINKDHISKIVETYIKKEEFEDFSRIMNSSDLEDSVLLPEKYIVEKELEDDILGQVRIKQNKLLANRDLLQLGGIVTDVYRGLNITASTVKEGQGPLRIIQLSDVDDGQIHLNHLLEGTPVRDSNIERYRVKKGDLIVSNRGTNIKIAVVPEVEGNVILSHNFIGLRLKDGIDPYYLKMYLESPLGQFELAQQQTGTTVLTITPTNIKKVHVLLSDESEKIGKIYNDIFQSYQEKLKRIEEERNHAIKESYEQAGLFEYIEVQKKGADS